MADIFLSYAREDETKIKGLVTALEAEGWSVFWDRRIPTGETWRSCIGAALESARCVIVAWSRHSIDSQWVAEEADDGKARKVLLPILLDSIQPPHGFREIQTADLSTWQPGQPSETFSSLSADIRRLLGKPPASVGVSVASPPAIDSVPVPQKPLPPARGRRFVLIGMAAFLLAGIAWFLFVPPPPDPKVVVVQPSRPVAPDHRLEPAAPAGSWVVVTASFKRFERQRVADQVAALRSEGIKATVLDSNEYPLLTPDLWVVAVGPFTSRTDANAALERVKARVPDAYVKQGR